MRRATAPRLLEIGALGAIDVRVDEQEVTLAEWKVRSARDLFFCLLAHPRGLTKEEIGLLLWPDCTSDQIQTRFKNTLYRLRRTLWPAVVTFERGLYHFNRHLVYEYDVETFLALAETAPFATDETTCYYALSRAFFLYRGPYLPSLGAPWVCATRGHLRRVFVGVGLELGELQLAAGQLYDALLTCNRLLVEVPYSEAAYRLSMRIHAATRNRDGVVRQYHELQTVLSEKFHVSPSLETRALFARLTE